MSRNNVVLIIIIVILILLYIFLVQRDNNSGSSGNSTTRTTFSECTSDAQCEGDSICNNGSCVETLSPEPEVIPATCDCNYSGVSRVLDSVTEEVFLTKGFHDGMLYVLNFDSTTYTIKRRLKNGLLDTSFGTSGILTLETPPGSGDLFQFAPLADGGFVFIVRVSSSDLRVAKYTSAGVLDPSFSVFNFELNGQFDFTGGRWITASKTEDSEFYLLYNTSGIPVVNFTQHLYKFTATGVDSTYGNQTGRSEFTFGVDLSGETDNNSDVNFEYMEMTDDEGLVLFQQGSDPADSFNERALVTKIDSDGNLDLTFGTDGHFWAIDMPRIEINLSDARGAIAQDGSIYWGGWGTDTVASTDISVIFKLTSDGTLDTTWGDSGYWFGESPPGDNGYEFGSIAVEPCGNVVATAINYSSNDDLHILKLNSDGQTEIGYPLIRTGDIEQVAHQVQITGGEEFGDPIYFHTNVFDSSLSQPRNVIYTFDCEESV